MRSFIGSSIFINVFELLNGIRDLNYFSLSELFILSSISDHYDLVALPFRCLSLEPANMLSEQWNIAKRKLLTGLVTKQIMADGTTLVPYLELSNKEGI